VDSGTTTKGENNQEVNMVTDEELANFAFGKSIQQKVHMAESVQEPTTTVRQNKGKQTLQKEDARREKFVTLKKKRERSASVENWTIEKFIKLLGGYPPDHQLRLWGR
jgi:hypothetical protein